MIQLKNEQVACTKQLDSEDAEQNAIKTSFTVHKSGAYKISVMVSGRHVKGSPFTKTFEPGEEIERIPVLFYECCKMSKYSSKRFLKHFYFTRPKSALDYTIQNVFTSVHWFTPK